MRYELFLIEITLIDIDIDIFGFIDNTMYGRIRVRLNPLPPQSSIARSGAGVGIALRVRLPLANSPKYRRSAARTYAC